jgi:hypothetical protein
VNAITLAPRIADKGATHELDIWPAWQVCSSSFFLSSRTPARRHLFVRPACVNEEPALGESLSSPLPRDVASGWGGGGSPSQCFSGTMLGGEASFVSFP